MPTLQEKGMKLKTKDKTGMHFDGFEVLRYVGHNKDKRCHEWLCKCELCGNEQVFPSSRLVGGLRRRIYCARCLRERRFRLFNEKSKEGEISAVSIGLQAEALRSHVEKQTAEFKRLDSLVGSIRKILTEASILNA